MKTIISLVTAITILLSTSATSFAQRIDSKDMGITFNISDNWTQISSYDGLYFVHNHNSNVRESVRVGAVDNPFAYSSKYIDAFDEAYLKETCDIIYSNDTLAKELSSQNNNSDYSITTESVVTNYEYYNGVKYYRYEKSYTARAYGYYDLPLYQTTLITARNGKMYYISYLRGTDANNFRDVAALLDSISFVNGEIKITIDNERIYPDSSPMIIEERTLVPIRAVAEKMGYSVSWDETYQIVTMTNGYDVLQFQINNYTAYKNIYNEISLDVPPIIFDDRTYLPLRAVAEAMNAQVNWDGNTRTVQIWQ